MRLINDVRVKEITPGAVIYEDSGAEENRLDADIVLYACGSRANSDVADKLRKAAPWCVVTGDARMARTVKMATYEGFCAAMDIL